MEVLGAGLTQLLTARSSGPMMAALKMGALFGAVGAIAGAASYAFKTPNVKSVDCILTRRAFVSDKDPVGPIVYEELRQPKRVASNADVSTGIRCLFENARISMESIYDVMIHCDKLLSVYAKLEDRSMPLHMIRDRKSRSHLRSAIAMFRTKAEDSLAECFAQSGWQISVSTGLPYNAHIRDRLRMLTDALGQLAAASSSLLEEHDRADAHGAGGGADEEPAGDGADGDAVDDAVDGAVDDAVDGAEETTTK